MRKTAVKIFVNGAGLYVASVAAKPGIEFQGTGFGLVWTVLLLTLIFGLVNTFNRPIVKFRSTGVQLVTLGLLTFVINALLLWLTSMLSEHLAVRFHIESFWYALIGGVIATTASLILHAVLPNDTKKS